MEQRQTFTAELKQNAIRLLEQADKPAPEITLDLGIKAFQGSGRKPKDEESEVARLKRELTDMTEERDILKKAAQYFA